MADDTVQGLDGEEDADEKTVIPPLPEGEPDHLNEALMHPNAEGEPDDEIDEAEGEETVP